MLKIIYRQLREVQIEIRRLWNAEAKRGGVNSAVFRRSGTRMD